MSAVGKTPVILHADQEHGGIRLVVFIALFIAYFIGFQLVALLIETLAPPAILDYTTFLACVGAAPLALLMIWILEKVLKRVWHSGVSIALDDRGLTVHDKRAGPEPGGVSTDEDGDGDHAAEPTIAWTGNLSWLNWYFRLSGYSRGGRERRIPAKWYCLATELQQDESRLNVYTFVPPDGVARWTEQPRYRFQLLNLAELREGGLRLRIGPPTRPTLPNHLLQSKEGRYWLAERRRWEYGIELTPEDYATLIDYAQTREQDRPDAI
jgi:hypothetical protein